MNDDNEKPKPRPARAAFALAAMAMAMMPMGSEEGLLIVDHRRARPDPEPPLPRDRMTCAALASFERQRPLSNTPDPDHVVALREKRAEKMARRDARARAAGRLK